MCLKNKFVFLSKINKNMIQINKDFYPLIYITFKDSDWNFEDYSIVMQIIEQDLKEIIKKGDLIQLMIAGNPEMTTYPSLNSCSWIVKDLFRIRPLLKDGIARTAIFKPDNKLDFFFDMLFAIYTPVKPVQIFKQYDDAYLWLTSE
jgi:hypothetical protein